MTKTIIVTTTTVTKKAEELKTLNNQFKKQLTQLKSTERTLNSMWEGEANNAFHQAFERDVLKMEKFYQTIENYVMKLKEIVKSYEKAEKVNLNTAQKRTV